MALRNSLSVHTAETVLDVDIANDTAGGQKSARKATKISRRLFFG
jgi:hypothetical protein